MDTLFRMDWPVGKLLAIQSYMYKKCGDPAAFRVFELMTKRTKVSWNTIINTCIRNGDFDWLVDILI